MTLEASVAISDQQLTGNIKDKPIAGRAQAGLVAAADCPNAARIGFIEGFRIFGHFRL